MDLFLGFEISIFLCLILVPGGLLSRSTVPLPQPSEKGVIEDRGA